MNIAPSQRRSWFEVVRLSLCNGLGISAAVVSVTISALAAIEIGWLGGWTTVPYGLQFMAALLASLPSSRLMGRIGRKPVFCLAALLGIGAGLLGSLAVVFGNPILLCAAHVVLGVTLANSNLYRFAALDVSTKENHSIAMSLVVFGGTFAALIGPIISRQPLFSPAIFESGYIGISVLNAVILVLIAGAKLPKPTKKQAAFSLSVIKIALTNRNIATGMTVAALGYGVMNLLMIASSISMQICSIAYHDISWCIQYHVLAMFLPSLLMGRIIALIDARAVAIIGLFILAAGSIVAVAIPDTLAGFRLSLIFLGLAWNMTYLGGSYLTAHASPSEHAFSLQAVHDTVIGVFAMIGAFAPGMAISQVGWVGLNKATIALAVLMLFCILLQTVGTGRETLRDGDVDPA